MSAPWLLLLGTSLLGCKHDKPGDDTSGGDDTATAWRPDLVCPGDAGCLSNDGELQAGAAALTITPTCFESWSDADGDATYQASTDSFLDCGCDQLCPGDAGYTAADEGEGDGVFQAVWMAGFGQGRAASGVHDDLWARAVVMRQGDVSVAIVTLDVVGWFYDETEKVRAGVDAAGLDVDHVIVHASHVHEGPDTLGQWGPNLTHTGADGAYMDQIVATAIQAVTQASADVQTVTLTTGSIDTAAPFGDKGAANTVRDSRDPRIIDEMMGVARLAAADGSTVATLVNWSNHPETVGSDNLLITSDYVHYLRQYVEQGVGGHPGLGGTCIFINGTVGGLMTPLGVTVTDPDGTDWSGDTFEKADALGRVTATLALQAVAEGSPESTPALSVRATAFYVPVENYAFQALFLLGIFERELFNYDPEQAIDEHNTPEIRTGMSLVRVGSLGMLSVPGELLPEVAIGGYDGSHVNSTQYEFISSSNDNPPDVSLAPAGPYFKDLIGGEHAWIIGLGNDEIGYLVPSYDYKLDASSPYLVDASGDHYEETNSIGPSAEPLVEEWGDRLLTWTP